MKCRFSVITTSQNARRNGSRVASSTLKMLRSGKAEGDENAGGSNRAAHVHKAVGSWRQTTILGSPHPP